MKVPQFIFDDEANANISEAFTITRQGLVHIELGSRAPVVILRQEGLSELALPRQVVELEQMPLNGTGKVDYPRLAEIAGGM